MSKSIKLDYSKELPWRQNYTETLMPYKGRRVDKVILGGGRDCDTTISGSRVIMAAGFLNGELQPITPTKRSQLSGLEEDYLKGDWGIFVNGDKGCDQIIVDVIECPTSFDDNIIIVHADAIRPWIINCTRVPKMMRNHSQYSTDMIINKDIRDRITIGGVIKAGERLTHTRGTMEDGNYGHGREANCVFISTMGTNEDTCCVLDTVPKDFATVKSEEFLIPINNETIPLNLWGNEDTYRCVPPVGTKIESGIILATRQRVREHSLVHRTKEALRTIRRPFDIAYNCEPGSEIVSVEVFKASTSKIMNHYLPEDATRHLDSLSSTRLARYHRIMELDKKFKRQYNNGKYVRGISWNVMVTEAVTHLFGKPLRSYVPDIGKVKEVLGTIEDMPTTGYLVKIKTRYVMEAHLGHKFNDPAGAKYVISEIRSRARMYKDQWGRVCEFATAGAANINRSIWKRLSDQYRGDAKYHLLRRMKALANNEGIGAAKDLYMRGMEVISEKTFWELSQVSEEDLENHVIDLITNEDFIQTTDEVGDEALTINGSIKIRESEFNPPYGKLVFIDYNGIERHTVNDIRIGPMYISVNEKVGSSYSAVNIPLRQVSGVNRKSNARDKKINQVSVSSSRNIGEPDFRMLMDAMPSEHAKMVLRDGTSQTTVRSAYSSILDGNMVPNVNFDGAESRGMEIFKSELMVDGIELTNVPRRVRWKK